MTTTNYPVEELGEYEDDGTMPANVAELTHHVVGRKIVSAEKGEVDRPYGHSRGLVLTLDDGTRVELVDSSDCCAYTELKEFFFNPELVDHAITGVGTEDGYETWHIFASMEDVLKLKVEWSAGNLGYYGYGFYINVVPAS